MTGYGRVRKTIEAGEIVVSLKTVNHKGLDLHFRMPQEFDSIESDLRAVVRSGVVRGHVQLGVSFAPTVPSGSGALNRALFESWLAAFHEAAGIAGSPQTPDIGSALRVSGMLAGSEGEADLDPAVGQAVMDATREAVAALNQTRDREGAATVAEIRERAGSIRALVDRIEGIRAGAVPAFLNRLRERLAELLEGAGVEPQRLAQEAALLADRSDISEELVRLRTHVDHLTGILDDGGEAGKRLDFLLQEMNREANTILSKTGGLGDLGLTITELGLAAKSEIDKIREQSLNLE